MALDTSRLRLICFDVDGTLRDTDAQYVDRLAKWLKPLRLFLPAHDVQRFARRLVLATEDPGRVLHGLPDRLGIDDEIARFSDWMYRLGPGKRNENFLLIEGVLDLLAALHERFPLAVVTARGERSTYAFLDYFELPSFFDHVAHAQTCLHTKPHPDPILWVAEQAGLSPADCLMVGDTIPDILAGKAAGAQTAGVLCGFGERDELEKCGADLILESTPELADFLLN